jgi:hypothetical protein
MRSFILMPVLFSTMLALPACSTFDNHEARQAQTQLVGLDEESLHMCAGLPTKTESLRGMTLETYEYSPNASTFALTLPLAGGINLGSSGYCHATFAIQNNQVKAVEYGGDTGDLFGHVSTCSPIVNNCLDNAQIAKGTD